MYIFKEKIKCFHSKNCVVFCHIYEHMHPTDKQRSVAMLAQGENCWYNQDDWKCYEAAY